MKISHILTEHFVNLITPAEKAPFKDQVWDLLQTAYAGIGGFKGAKDADELADTPGLWKLSRRNGKIVTVAVYKDVHGRKSIASGTDGSIEGRRDFHNIKNADLNMKRMWVEASGAIEHILNKSKAKTIPNKFAGILTGKEILNLNPDGVHYTRLIAGHPYEKIIFGFVQVDDALMAKLEAAGIQLHELPDNMTRK